MTIDSILDRELLHANHLKIICLIFLVLSCTGCTVVGIDYVRPNLPLPSKWHNRLVGGLASQDSPRNLSEWWKTLNDEDLTRLINIAIEGNLDIKTAKAAVRQYRAARNVASANLLPNFSLSGSATQSRISENLDNENTTTDFNSGLDASWELDLFGGKRRSLEAAEADFQTGEEKLRDVLVSLIADVASCYIDLRTSQARLEVAENNIKIQEDTYNLNLCRYEAGLIDQLAVQQALYNLESTRSQLPRMRVEIEKAKNNLAFLLGKQPGTLQKELTDRKPLPLIPVEVAIGIPADILRQRPDIRKAERSLAAATARVGVAEAELYPKLTLSGSIGLTAATLGGLFSLNNAGLSGTSSVMWPLFDFGRVRQNIEIQSAQQEQSLFEYEKTVLSALKEVEEALSSYAEEQKSRRSLDVAAKAAAQAVELAQYNYESGLIDFNSVLLAQASLLTYQEQLTSSGGRIISCLISIYKRLGGGWEHLMPAKKTG